MNLEKIIILMMILSVASVFVLINPLTDESTNLSLVNEVKHITNEIGPRPAGSTNERQVAEYLQSRFNDYGVSTQIEEFQYYSDSNSIKKSQNVIGTINGTSKKQIIICADLDTYKDPINGSYTEGANDDTTSLAVLIGLAKHYKQNPPYYTIKLIGFGAGEDPYTFPVNASPRTSLDQEEYDKIMYIPYLIGARQYVLDNQDSLNDTIAVISLEAVGIGDSCFVGQDSFAENNQTFVDFLVLNARNNGFNACKIDFMTYRDLQGRDGPISHIYLPFSYANIPSTFLTCMKNPNIPSIVHNNSEMPGYLTVADDYENLLKMNGNEKELQKHLDYILYLVEDNINGISKLYKAKTVQMTLLLPFLYMYT